MIKWVASFFQHVCVFLCALLFLQFPLFMQAYQQQLIGHVAEIRWHVTIMRDAATKSGKTLEQYIQKFRENSDADFSRQGASMHAMLERSQKLAKALKELQSAPIYMRPLIFLTYLDWDIMTSTAHAFEPGIPFSLEGVLYALSGMLLGVLLCTVLGQLPKHHLPSGMPR